MGWFGLESGTVYLVFFVMSFYFNALHIRHRIFFFLLTFTESLSQPFISYYIGPMEIIFIHKHVFCHTFNMMALICLVLVRHVVLKCSIYHVGCLFLFKLEKVPPRNSPIRCSWRRRFPIIWSLIMCAFMIHPIAMVQLDWCHPFFFFFMQ